MAATHTTPISQSEINKAVWNACDTFRGVVSADTYKDFILTISDDTPSLRQFVAKRYK